MSVKSGAASHSAISRLKQDYLRLKRDPVPYIIAEPLPSNILEWHYVVEGPEKTPYYGGFYHGKLVFPREFPFKPPSVYMITPTGRFRTNTRLCLSISDYHPESWNPAWSVSSILTGLLSFMLEKSPTFGSLETRDCEKQMFAINSLESCIKDKTFVELFPETVTKIQAELQRRAELETAARENFNVGTTSSSEPSTLQSAIANFGVLVGVAAFAYIVKFVIRGQTLE